MQHPDKAEDLRTSAAPKLNSPIASLIEWLEAQASCQSKIALEQIASYYRGDSAAPESSAPPGGAQPFPEWLEGQDGYYAGMAKVVYGQWRDEQCQGKGRQSSPED